VVGSDERLEDLRNVATEGTVRSRLSVVREGLRSISLRGNTTVLAGTAEDGLANRRAVTVVSASG
jgi:hypothetical protein